MKAKLRFTVKELVKINKKENYSIIKVNIDECNIAQIEEKSNVLLEIVSEFYNYNINTSYIAECDLVNDKINIYNVVQVGIHNNVLNEAYSKLKGIIDRIDVEVLLQDTNDDLKIYINNSNIRNKKRVIELLQYYRNKNILLDYSLKLKINIEETNFTEYFMSFKQEEIKYFISEHIFLFVRFEIPLKILKRTFDISDTQENLYYIYDAIYMSVNSGDTFIYIDDLKTKINEKYKLNNLEYYCNLLVEENFITINDGKVYLKEIFEFEDNLINNLKMRIINNKEISNEFENKINQFLNNYNNQIEIKNEQKQAIYNTLKYNISIIEGPGGCGKSTLINIIFECINFIYGNSKKIVTTAFTGKAASRLNDENISLNASTIHSLLKLKNNYHIFNTKIIEDIDFLIIDESSMLDVQLLSLLLNSVKSEAHVIIVGDIQQLQPIGIGSPFMDIIECGCISKTTLRKIYRYKEDSSIFKNAYNIRNMEIDKIKFDRNFYFIESKSNNIMNALEQEVKSLLNKGYKSKDMIIISPTNKRINDINNLMKKILNVSDFNYKFNVGDRVIQNVNDYKSNVFNGNIGVITQLTYINNKLNTMVKFGNKEIVYEENELLKLNLAYATTIHKMQGSQNKVIIILMDEKDYKIADNNLLYVAVTRAQEKISIIGDKKAFLESLNKRAKRRNSSIKQGLLEQRLNYKVNLYDLKLKEILKYTPDISRELRIIC